MNTQKPLLSFGAVADLQYCDADPEINRYFRNAPTKLSEAIKVFNESKLDFVINLGDTIDHDWKSYDGILPHFEASNSRVYHVLGNHDYEIDDQFKSQVHERIGTEKYYGFSLKNWRFIILDGNEISTYANIKGSENYAIAENYLSQSKVNSNFWNGGIGEKQLSWLAKQLKTADEQNEKTTIFCHFPIYPSHRHNLLNDEEVLEIIKSYNCVTAWVCGHNHDGNYGMSGNIHFINLKGIVDTDYDLAFSIFHLFDHHIEIRGFGNEISAKLNL